MTQERPAARKRRFQALESSKPTKPVAKRSKKATPLQPPRLLNNETPTARLDVYVFGDGSAGELGLGTQDATDVTGPRLNVNLEASTVGVVDIATGGMHAVALTHDGKILTWGVNESTPTTIPSQSFAPESKIISVTAGDSASFALTQQGHVYGWGTFVSNEARKGFLLVQNQLIEKQEKPILIPGLEDHSVDRHSSAMVSEAQLDKLYLNIGLVPSRVPFSPRIRIASIHAGSDHAFAIDYNGNTWAWSLNKFGQTGVKAGAGANGTTIVTPQKVQSLFGRKMKMIQGGTHHSVGVTQDGECLVWGRMDGAQMGIDISTLPINDQKLVVSEREKPRILLEPTALPIAGCSYVAAGSDHNIVITSEGRAYSWGFNANYQCGQGPKDDDITDATLIGNSAVRHRRLSWAVAGGQYSMLAGPHAEGDTPPRSDTFHS